MSRKYECHKGKAKSKKFIGKKRFHSAYVTDTRLMGVLALSITWELPKASLPEKMYQFFYIDVEDYGIERYRSTYSNQDHANHAPSFIQLERSFIGGLGSKQVEISLREAMWLLQKYAHKTIGSNCFLPEPIDEYRDLLENTITLSEPERYLLECKQCTTIDSPFQSINYFLMRCFAQDWEGAAYLSSKTTIADAFIHLEKGVLYKNIIKETQKPNTYHCTSLIEGKNAYYIADYEITIDGLHITDYCYLHSHYLSTAQSAQLLANAEYICVIQLRETPERFNQDSTPMLDKSTMRKGDSGDLFILYKANNLHVSTDNYCLFDDFYGSYFYNKNKEITLMATSREHLKLLINDILTSKDLNCGDIILKHRFKHPIFYDFVLSDSNSFMRYISTIMHIH